MSDEEDRDNLIRGINQDIDILYQIPQTIRQAVLVCENLPLESKARAKIIAHVKKLRRELIQLDVVCQDIEWAMTDRNLKQQEKFFKEFKFSNTATANTN